MRYKELKESVDFSACTMEPRTDGDGYMLSPHNWREEETDCDICDGDGVIDYPTMNRDPISPGKWACGLCRGTGKLTDHVCDGPKMNVSNMNAAAIVRDMIGQEWDDGGLIEKKALPALRKKLFRMINLDSERSSMHLDPSREQGPMRRIKGDDGIDRIGRGATMISGGRTDPQVLRYATTLLDMVDYAMKHDLVISWG